MSLIEMMMDAVMHDGQGLRRISKCQASLGVSGAIAKGIIGVGHCRGCSG